MQRLTRIFEMYRDSSHAGVAQLDMATLLRAAAERELGPDKAAHLAAELLQELERGAASAGGASEAAGDAGAAWPDAGASLQQMSHMLHSARLLHDVDHGASRTTPAPPAPRPTPPRPAPPRSGHAQFAACAYGPPPPSRPLRRVPSYAAVACALLFVLATPLPGRFFAALSLREAEHLRALMHRRQGQGPLHGGAVRIQPAPSPVPGYHSK